MRARVLLSARSRCACRRPLTHKPAVPIPRGASLPPGEPPGRLLPSWLPTFTRSSRHSSAKRSPRSRTSVILPTSCGRSRAGSEAGEGTRRRCAPSRGSSRSTRSWSVTAVPPHAAPARRWTPRRPARPVTTSWHSASCAGSTRRSVRTVSPALSAWKERRPAPGKGSERARLQYAILDAQERNGALLARSAEWAQDRKRLRGAGRGGASSRCGARAGHRTRARRAASARRTSTGSSTSARGRRPPSPRVWTPTVTWTSTSRTSVAIRCTRAPAWTTSAA